jgi:thymidylate synthase
MVLPPCHYGFQVYTRELSLEERYVLYVEKLDSTMVPIELQVPNIQEYFDILNVPRRAISLMWNQRSVDTFLGLPFNIASYGLLLELIAKAVGMVSDELIGNLGDVHLYNNHIDQAKEQITRESYDLPKVEINTEFWPVEEGKNSIDAVAVFNNLQNDEFCNHMLGRDIKLYFYQSHPQILAPLSN